MLDLGTKKECSPGKQIHSLGKPNENIHLPPLYQNRRQLVKSEGGIGIG